MQCPSALGYRRRSGRDLADIIWTGQALQVCDPWTSNCCVSCLDCHYSTASLLGLLLFADMATRTTTSTKHSLEDLASPAPKRFKPSELPLSSSQRSSIDGLLHTIKKKGEYDTIRKQVWSQFTEGEEKAAFSKSLHELAEAEIDRDPSLLSRDRGKAATLMQGAVDRSDIYKNVEKALDDLIAKNIGHIIKAGREIRRAEVGEEVAAEEERRGAKTDEEYATEIALKRQERVRARKQEETRKRREDQKEALRLEEAQKMKELEVLRSRDEKRKEREALRASRESARKKLRNPTKEESEKKIPQDPPVDSPITSVPPIDEKALEEIALAQLIQDAKDAAAKNAPKIEQDRSLSPHLKSQISPPKGPAAMRARDPNKARIGFSSIPAHVGSPIPPPPSMQSRSRSPFHASASHHNRSRSTSRTGYHIESMRDDDRHREIESEATAALKAQLRDRRASEATAYKDHDDGDCYERRSSYATERDSMRDRERERDERRGSKYDYDYKDSRDARYRGERPRSRDRDRHHHDDRSTYTRGPREEAPEHIDRYVPGGALARDKRDKDVTGKDREIREHDDMEQDVPGEARRDRGSYYDTDRERQYYKKESRGGRDDYREKDRGSHLPRERHRDYEYRDRDRRGERVARGHGYREKNRRDERPYVRTRTDEPPEHIDRYVPGK